MPRNSAGLFTIAEPAFIPGTTALSAKVNSNNSDIGAEITDSLNRSGKGGMLAQLKLTDGTAAAPSPSYTSAADMGVWRNGANDFRVTAGSAVSAMRWTLTAITSFLAFVAEKGATFTNSTTNGAGVTSTGDGTASGVIGIGGSTAGVGVAGVGGVGGGTGMTATGVGTGGFGLVAVGGTGTSAINAMGGAGTSGGVQATGSGTGAGVAGTGGSSAGTGVSGTGGVAGVGVQGIGGSSGGTGLVGTGGTGGKGATIAAGTAATGPVPQVAAELTNGHLKLSGANPSSTVGFANALTPMHVPKAWGVFTSNAAGGVTVNDGVNVASAVLSGDDIVVTFGTAFASSVYAVSGSVDQTTETVFANAKAAGNATLRAAGSGGTLPLSTQTWVVNAFFFGRQ